MTEKDLDSRSARSRREVLLLLLLFSFSFSLLLFPTPLLGERQGGSARQAHEEKVPVEKKDRTGRREEGGRKASLSLCPLACWLGWGSVYMYVWWVHNAKRGERGRGDRALAGGGGGDCDFTNPSSECAGMIGPSLRPVSTICFP